MKNETPLPPLPLVDGALIIDNATIEKLKCPRLLALAWLHRRSLVASKAGRNFGAGLHEGLRVRYQECGNKACTPDAFVKAQAAMQAYFAGKPQPELDFRTFNHACAILQGYNDAYGDEPFDLVTQPKHCKNPGKPIIEESFCIPFAEVQNIPVFYAGRIDLAVKLHTVGGIWSQDHKTAFRFGDEFDKQMAEDGGQRGYVWALREILGVKPDGYVIDALRIRRPTKNAEYSGTVPIDGTDFKRFPRYLSEDDLDEWKEDTINLISDILWHYDRAYFPRHRWQCVGKYGACEYYDVCSLSRDQRKSALASNLYENDDWSPLKPPPKKESE